MHRPISLSSYICDARCALGYGHGTEVALVKLDMEASCLRFFLGEVTSSYSLSLFVLCRPPSAHVTLGFAALATTGVEVARCVFFFVSRGRRVNTTLAAIKKARGRRNQVLLALVRRSSTRLGHSSCHLG